MSKVLRRIMLAVLVIAGIIAGYRSIQDSTVPLDSLLAFSTAEDGYTILSWYDGDHTVIAHVGRNGSADKSIRFRTESGDSMYNIKGVASGARYT